MTSRLLVFPYHHPSDLEIITDLLPRCRTPKTISDPPGVIDIKEMLENPVIHSRTRIWTTHEGLPVGYMLVDNYNNLVFDFLSGFLSPALEDQVVKLASEFLHEKLQILEETSLDATVREENESRIAMLMRNGFHRQPVETLAYERDVTKLAAESAVSTGYTIRQFKGEVELQELVALHQAAFATKALNETDRKAIMSTPEYDPVLDIVIVSPDGKLAGYAISSIDKVGNQIGGTMLGGVDTVAVHPDHQRKGLASSLLERSLKLMRLYGMEKVSLSTTNENTAMQKTAVKSGFALGGKRIWFSKKIHRS